MTIFDADVIVSGTNIQFGEIFSTLDFLKKLLGLGNGCSVADGMFVKFPIILASLVVIVLLADKEEQ